jgi:hypothetical protein
VGAAAPVTIARRRASWSARRRDMSGGCAARRRRRRWQRVRRSESGARGDIAHRHVDLYGTVGYGSTATSSLDSSSGQLTAAMAKDSMDAAAHSSTSLGTHRDLDALRTRSRRCRRRGRRDHGSCNSNILALQSFVYVRFLLIRPLPRLELFRIRRLNHTLLTWHSCYA